MTIVNNWGHWIDSEIPTYGAVSMNSLEHIGDEIDYHSIDLTYLECEHYYIEEAIAEWEKDNGESFNRENADHAELSEEWKVNFSDLYMDNGESEYLIGAWNPDEHGMYFPDHSGEYSAIVYTGSNIVIVEWSKYVTRCALCSPCYPNSGDLDTSGEFLAYDLPMDLYGEYRQNENAPFEYIAPSDNEAIGAAAQ